MIEHIESLKIEIRELVLLTLSSLSLIYIKIYLNDETGKLLGVHTSFDIPVSIVGEGEQTSISLAKNHKNKKNDVIKIQKKIYCDLVCVGHIQTLLQPDFNYSNSLIISIENAIYDLKLQIALVLKKYIFRLSIIYNHDSSEIWIGNSIHLKKVEKFMIKFSGVDFPVLINGERGTGKGLVAFAIHKLGYRKNKKFIECCCIQWDENDVSNIMKKYYQQADEGTLFLRNINVLSHQSIDKIRHYWEHTYIGMENKTRIICSTSPYHNNSIINESSGPWLTIQLPSLSERKKDIKALTQMLLNKYSSVNKISFDHKAWEILEEHQWKDNVKGLERAIVVLTVISDEQQINSKKLSELLPELTIDEEYRNNSSSSVLQKHYNTSKLQSVEVLEQNINRQSKNVHLATFILENDFSVLPKLHPAVSKSLSYMLLNFTEKITLVDMANKVFISTHHLSYLYNKNLKISFKQLLLHLRIVKAMSLLSKNIEKSITQISVDVGFHDLSHFEKTFKKIMDINPLQFREQNRLY